MKRKYCITKTMLPYLWLLLFSIFATQHGFAQVQSQSITGTVTSAGDGMSVPGANVFVEGTQNATSTDFDGKFTINAKTGDVLKFSFIGFKTQSVTVGTQKVINVVLQSEAADLKEVVVIGYGTQKRTTVTSAITQVSGDNLTKTNTVNALQALQGQAAGLQITSTSGQPGEGLNVVIRGIGSTSGSSPLYVVDGILTGDISYLNNADIESISVLKDAASAAIYGSQASNGVVLVTTKKGKRNSVGKINLDQYYGVQ